ncbi:OmpA family protein [Flavihumibacter profundi]|uniref:OmpA family protein n=1 Tax=Flavihumibacter profundi TaxID=2716883 RepID=UPI001CC698A9|nr:OmpA family protein [Flavihumibacter profundi]MBZ5857274.1 OmpA family protein [Flavihumibacter profundi]
MANKKFTALLGLLCLFASSSFSQIGTSYDVQDSSLIPRKRLPQHNEFMNNAYPFPAKPRSQWEVGIKGGLFNIFGDVPSNPLNFGGGVHVRKSLGYVFSLRGEFMYGVGKGLNWKERTSGFSQPARDAGYGTAAAPVFFDNYKTTMKDLNLQALISLNNINFHRDKSKWDVYALIGGGLSWWKTMVNAKDASGNPYNYSTVTNPNVYSDRKKTKDQLKAIMDDSYESPGETDGEASAKLSGNTLKPNFQFGAGFAYKLSPKINLSVEDRFTVTKSDLLDGVRYQNTRTNNNSPYSNVLTPDYDTYNYFTVGLNFNLGKNSVEPMYWLNPLAYPYSELNSPKHMKLPKPILDDADGDGVTDQFDLEPNTPQGAPVDSHGVSKDTDGDGVPDFKDKELITPTQCQPVDADGIGKCPEPPCCKELREGGFQSKAACSIGDLPSITFPGRTVSLDNDSKAVLASVAEKIRNNPNCKIAVIGYGESSKSAQQLSWDRVNAVINYLVEKEGISADRFIFKYGEGGGDPNTVDLRDGTAEEGPNAVPAPHPNLRKKG